MGESSSTEPALSEIDPDLAPGESVGEYVVEGKLGQGGFGAVFRASHPLIGKVVAIKVLARRFSVDPEMVERFQAEARAVNQIRHRHIIDIFSFGTLADGRHYYVMEYLEGETLDARLEREGKLGVADALPILRAIGKALDAAHAKGIAHRDLKPENVFLARDPDGVDFPKLLDFGIAKLLRRDDGIKSKTRTGVPMGTPYYMSPEQCRGRDVDHRTDYYAFGIVAYQMLTGTYPIDGDDYMQILMQQLTDDPPPASSRNPDLTTEIDDALAWLMRKAPDDRPPNLMTAVKALEAGAGLAPRVTSSVDLQAPPRTSPAIPAQPATPMTRMTMAAPPARKSLAWLYITGALLVVAGAIVVVALSTHRGDDDAEPAVAAATTPPPKPAPAPTPAPPPPPAPVEPAKPATITLTITGAPTATEVHGPGGQFLGNPPTIQLARGDADVVLTFEADGFKPTSRTVKPASDQTLAIKLDKKPAVRPSAPVRPAQPPATQDTIEDPFRH